MITVTIDTSTYIADAEPPYWFVLAHVSAPYGEYNSPFSVQLPESATEAELKAAIAAQFP